MVRKTLIYITLCVLTCTLTSCFQIIEDLKCNADGSGTLKVTINLSESKTKVKSIMLLDSINGHKVPKREDIEAELSKAKSQLLKAEGVTGVTLKQDWEQYIFVLNCDFSNLELFQNSTRNMALKSMKDTSKLKGQTRMFTDNVYQLSGNTFTRKGGYSVKKDYDKLKPEDRKVFETAQFIGIYRFQKPVKSASNPKAKLSKSGTAVMVRAQILDLIFGKADLANEIQF